jgi:hypothetical protein
MKRGVAQRQPTEAYTIDRTHRKNYPVEEKPDRTKLGPGCVDMLTSWWHKFGKNGEAKPRMIKLLVVSIRPRRAVIMIEELLLEHRSDDRY